VADQPVSYFKYLTASSANAVLKNRTLRWATCPTFNDPADMQIDLEVIFDRDEVVRLALDLLWQRCEGKSSPATTDMARLIDMSRPTWLRMGRDEFGNKIGQGIHQTLDKLPIVTKKFSEELRSKLATIKVICFSERHDCNLMWSHYAESHSGLVLEFRNVDGLDSPYKMAKPIQYSARPPQFATNEELARFISGDDAINRGLTDRMIYTKSDEWAYETEWRIQSGDGRKPGDPIEYAGFGDRELHAVYFGCKSSQETKDSLMPVIRKHYPYSEIWQAKREMHTYALSFDRV